MTEASRLISRLASKSISKKNKENATQRGPPGKSKSKSDKNIIEVDGDSDTGGLNGSDSEVQEVTEMDALQAKIKQNRKAASQIRLTPKVEGDLPGRTTDFLKLRDSSRKRTDPSKTSSILFKVDLFLLKPMGKKTGTRVPMQSRSFQFEDVCHHQSSTKSSLTCQRIVHGVCPFEGGRYVQ